MVDSIHIKNFKSVVDLELDLGYFNVLIGENGCGKSNILEAIAFGGAAIADKLDHEFMSSRGIRLTQPKFMMSAFVNGESKKKSHIDIDVKYSGRNLDIVISPPSRNNTNWELVTYNILRDYFAIIFGVITSKDSEANKREKLNTFESIDTGTIDYLLQLSKYIKLTNPKESKSAEKLFVDGYMTSFMADIYNDLSLKNFIIYSPEQTSLRNFEGSSQIIPLGIKGEGLFQHLRQISIQKRSQKQIAEIKSSLSLIDWYADINVPSNLLSNEYKLEIGDRYLKDTLGFFDQRSTNEGFLYLLFYFTLFTSKETPAFFAIDNIDTALNPKLCSELIRLLAKLAKKHKKQVILTTHNPAVLDGLNLKDDGQRLFVVRRNEEGHTKAKRIEYKPERTMKLSEVWTKGFIGGLPDNF